MNIKLTKIIINNYAHFFSNYPKICINFFNNQEDIVVKVTPPHVISLKGPECPLKGTTGFNTLACMASEIWTTREDKNVYLGLRTIWKGFGNSPDHFTLPGFH